MKKIFDYNPHEEYMARAIELAKRGHGNTSPNPMVGCVIVMDGEIIGEGYHKEFGCDHAEVDAFNNAVKLPMDVSVYVNLEPCATYGKTPPCIDVLLKNSVKEVYIGCLDPNMNKQGLEALNKAGIKVETGVLEDKCFDLNKGFFNVVNYKRPWTIVKLAQSSEGYIGIDSNQSVWITGEESKLHTHTLRSQVDAILIGRQTALIDNPNLTVRKVVGENPKRLILDTDRKLPMNLNIFNHNDQKTIVFCSNKRFQNTHTAQYQYVATEESNGMLDPNDIINKVTRLGINSLLIEGGAQVIKSFIKFNLIDEVYIYTAPKSLSNAKLKNPIIINEDWIVTSEQIIGEDKLIIARKKEKCLQEL